MALYPLSSPSNTFAILLPPSCQPPLSLSEAISPTRCNSAPPGRFAPAQGFSFGNMEQRLELNTRRGRARDRDSAPKRRSPVAPKRSRASGWRREHDGGGQRGQKMKAQEACSQAASEFSTAEA